MPRTANQIVGAVFGAVYVLVGLFGFAVTGGLDFAAREGDMLLGVFEVNPLHNVVHLVVGAALLFAGTSTPAFARGMNLVVGAGYLVIGLFGLYMTGNTDDNVLAANVADNLLHFGSAALLLGVALLADRRQAVFGYDRTAERARTGIRH